MIATVPFRLAHRITPFGRWRVLFIAAAATLVMCGHGLAQPGVGVAATDIEPLVKKAAEFLAKRQNADGSFSPRAGGPGITALVAAGLIRNGYKPDDPVVAKALKYLESKVQPDGGIYERMLANYTTCVALLAFKGAMPMAVTTPC